MIKSYLRIKADSTAEAYVIIDNVGKVGIGIAPSEALSLPDDGKISLGTGGDLKLYHDASNSYIDNSTGLVLIRTAGTKNAIVLEPDSTARIYHNGSEKISTSATGVTVTGRAVVGQVGTQTAISLGDDAVTSFTPPVQYGMVIIHSISTDFGIVGFDASTGTAETRFGGRNAQIPFLKNRFKTS